MANKTSVYTLNFGEKILFGIIYGLTYLLSLLPLCVLYIIADGIYLLVYKVVGYRKKLVRKNLTDSFPDKSQKEIIDIEKKFYHFLADYVVETLKLLSVSKKEMRRRVTYSNLHYMNDAEAKGQSVTILLGHYCNWEWVTTIGMFIDKKTFGGQIYHILENKVMDKFFLILRERMGPKCVPMSEILRRRVECHRDGRVMVMGYIADQVPFWNNIHYWTDFLNHDTPVLTGAETITKRFNDRAIYLNISRPRRGYYHIDLQLLADESKNIPDWEITEAFTRALEKSIQRAPQYWLWTHNRWKRTREEWLKMVDPKTGKVLMR